MTAGKCDYKPATELCLGGCLRLALRWVPHDVTFNVLINVCRQRVTENLNTGVSPLPMALSQPS